ncbi:MAG TPA: alpha-N-arabinofuranosidase, partial [Clostridiales bacterium]|nr:alpha-N-arabinofuranosidase [Clostridiales bacterium]
YHAFNMYKFHQDASLVQSSIESEMIGLEDDNQVPNLHESASVGEDGKLHITLTNLSIMDSYEINTILTDSKVKKVKGTLLAGDMSSLNTFENPNNVEPREFKDLTVTDNGVTFTIPACSVLELEVEM